MNPHVAVAYHNLGLIAQQRGRPEQAIPMYERALEEDPGLLWALINLGLLYENAGRSADALPLYLRIVELDPANERAWYSAAYILVQGGRPEEALELLVAAGRAHPSSPRPPLYRAQVYRSLGDLAAVERELRAALALDPGNAEAQQGLDSLGR